MSLHAGGVPRAEKPPALSSSTNVRDCPPFFPLRGREALLTYRLLRRLGAVLPRGHRAFPSWMDPICSLRPFFPVNADVLQAAEEVLGGHVRLWDHLVPIGDAPNWHVDPLSGHAWPAHRRVRIYPPAWPAGALRRVWELNRMQWLVSLGLAYRATRRREFLTTGWRHVLDWIARNPAPLGVNWTSPLEMTFRVMAWLCFLDLTESHPPSAQALFWESVATQTSHVAWHLSLSPRPHNHLAGEALLLLAVGTRYPSLPGAARWRRLGRDLLTCCVDSCIRPDGAPAEESLAYLSFVLEVYAVASSLLHAAGQPPLPARVRTRVAAGMALCARVAAWCGGMPSFGDSDDARLLPFADPVACSPDPTRTSASPPSVAEGFACSSFALGRSGDLTVLCALGNLGLAPLFGHGHAHALSLSVWRGGEPIVVDPGTFTYQEQPWRDYFRSTAAHSTVEVEGVSQAVPVDDFTWRAPYTCVARHRVGSHGFSLRASHTGYHRLRQRVSHRRRMTLSPGCLVVEDSLCGRAPFHACLHWHLHPSCAVISLQAKEADLAAPSGRIRLTVRGPGTIRAYRGSLQPLLGWYSGRFESREPTTTLRVEAQGSFVRWTTCIEPV